MNSELYVDELGASVAFYRGGLGIRILEASSRLVSMDAGQGTVLLLFHRGATVSGLNTLGGWIPPHDGHGPVHLAFAITAEALSEWERHLQACGVAIESQVS